MKQKACFSVCLESSSASKLVAAVRGHPHPVCCVQESHEEAEEEEEEEEESSTVEDGL